MKAALLALALVFSSPSYVEASSAQHETCLLHAGLARAVLEQRISGVSLEEMMDWFYSTREPAEELIDELVDEFTKLTILLVYETPWYLLSVEEFYNTIYIRCMVGE